MYTELIATMGVLLVIFALCWWLEVRSTNAMRERHLKAWDERYEQELKCRKEMNRDFQEVLAKTRHEAWQEGVRMGAEARRQMRYGQQFHHSKQGKF